MLKFQLHRTVVAFLLVLVTTVPTAAVTQEQDEVELDTSDDETAIELSFDLHDLINTRNSLVGLARNINYYQCKAFEYEHQDWIDNLDFEPSGASFSDRYHLLGGLTTEPLEIEQTHLLTDRDRALLPRWWHRQNNAALRDNLTALYGTPTSSGSIEEYLKIYDIYVSKFPFNKAMQRQEARNAERSEQFEAWLKRYIEEQEAQKVEATVNDRKTSPPDAAFNLYSFAEQHPEAVALAIRINRLRNQVSALEAELGKMLAFDVQVEGLRPHQRWINIGVGVAGLAGTFYTAFRNGQSVFGLWEDVRTSRELRAGLAALDESHEGLVLTLRTSRSLVNDSIDKATKELDLATRNATKKQRQHLRKAKESLAEARKAVAPALLADQLQADLDDIKPIKRRVVKQALGATIAIPMYVYFTKDFLLRIAGNGSVLFNAERGTDHEGKKIEYKIDGSLDSFATLYQLANQRDSQWWGLRNYVNIGESWELARASRVIFVLGKIEARLVELEVEMYAMGDEDDELREYFDRIPPIFDAKKFLRSIK